MDKKSRGIKGTDNKLPIIDLNYTPTEQQLRFHETTARFKAFIGGVGSGKTYANCQESIVTAIQYPNSVGMIVAPTYKMLADATQKTFFELCPRDLPSGEKFYSFLKGENKVKFFNESEILFRSADEPENLRGPNLDWFSLDEAGKMSYMTWKVMIGRIRKGVLDKAWITTTPKGYNWIWEEFVRKKRDNYAIFHCYTTQNPFLPLDYIQSLIESYSGAFARQELFGEFVKFEGLVYPEFQRVTHCYNKDKKFQEIILGMDFGFTNPSVALVLGFDSDGRIHVIDEFYQRRVSMEVFIKEAKAFQQKYNAVICYADPSEPQYIISMKQDGMAVKEADNQIIPGIAKVQSYLTIREDGNPRLFVHERCVNTIDEFESYQYPEDKEGKPIVDKPLKINDHAMDALRYALLTHTTQGTIKLMRDKEGVIF